MKQTKCIMWMIGMLACMTHMESMAQRKAIGIDEALRIARENYAGLDRDRKAIVQYEKLTSAGLPKQPAQLFFSSEEFRPNDQIGVHSLVIQQNFFLPKASEAQRNYYQKSAELAKKQYLLTDLELEREIRKAYLQLLYGKENLALMNEYAGLFDNFYSITSTQLETGETGKLPQLAAQSRLGQARLEQEHAEEIYLISLSLFNQWLLADSVYEADGDLASYSYNLVDTSVMENRHIQLMQAQIDVAEATIGQQQAQLLPQISSALRLQNSFGNFPAFGFQLGMNVPLFRKSYEGQIEAAQIGVEVQEAALLTEQRRLKRTTSEIQYRIEHQTHIIEFLQDHLSPLVNEQSSVHLQAYREGESGYLEYLDSLEQVLKVKRQLLEALFEYHVLQVDLAYWNGQ